MYGAIEAGANIGTTTNQSATQPATPVATRSAVTVLGFAIANATESRYARVYILTRRLLIGPHCTMRDTAA
jgi:hypothetical protein